MEIMVFNNKEFDLLDDYLRSVGQFLTRPRKIILETFLQVDGHVSVKNLCKEVKKKDSQISPATVYRTMKLLVESGIASENEFADDRKIFEKIHGKEHHDHMFCTHCKKISEFHNETIEKLQEEVAQEYLFEITSHRMTLFGVCNECN
jgi:Fur family transcriptional regulator, ferric uptake regulator